MRESKPRSPVYRAVGVALTILATAAIALDAAMFAIWGGAYGFGLFVGVPFFIGFFAVAIAGPRPLWKGVRIAAATGLVLALVFLALGEEGLLCIAMAVPLALPIIMVGALSAHFIIHRAGWIDSTPAAGIVLLVLFAGLAVERRVDWVAPVYVVQDYLDVGASADQVWEAVVKLGELSPPSDWLLRTGVACPQRVEMTGDGVGARRTCTLSTGAMEELITAWEPGERLRWDVASTPPPLRELNPIRQPDPPHLHGFFKSLWGEFEIVRADASSTRLWRRTAYQHNLYPAAYWRLWGDLVTRRTHLYVLDQVKQIAERTQTIADDPRLSRSMPP